MTKGALRIRVWFVGLAVGTMTVGLAVHWHGIVLGPTFQDTLGDALWAAMIAWWVAAISPTTSLRTRGTAALTICFAVEVSQRWQLPALDALRRTTFGHLLLGSGFDPRDFVSYACGILAAMLLEWLVREGSRIAPSRAAL